MNRRDFLKLASLTLAASQFDLLERALWVPRPQIVVPGMGRDGRTFWVHQATGNDRNVGSHKAPLASWAEAMSRCSDDSKEVVILMPGHEEVMDGRLEIGPNTTVISQGAGEERGRFTWPDGRMAQIGMLKMGALI